MTPPKHPADDELKAYIDSEPPPSEIEALEKSLEDRFDTPTGVHDFRNYKNLKQEMIINRVKDKYEDEHELRIKAEAKVAGIWKWFAITASGITVILVATLIIWFVTTAIKSK